VTEREREIGTVIDSSDLLVAGLRIKEGVETRVISSRIVFLKV